MSPERPGALQPPARRGSELSGVEWQRQRQRLVFAVEKCEAPAPFVNATLIK